MAEADLDKVADGLAELAATKVNPTYAWPPQSVKVPCFVVGYPDIDFDTVMSRGGDRLTYPCWYIVAKTGEKVDRTRMAAAILDLKDALDGVHSDVGSVRVKSGTVESTTVEAVTYLAVRFAVEVLT